MSLQLAIPWQVGLHQSLPPLCQPGTVSCNIVLPVDGFSSTRRFQNLGQKRVQFSVTFLNEATRPVRVIDARQKKKNRSKSSVRAKVEHVFRILKRIFGFDKVRYRGIAKNHNRLCANFALVNLYLHRKRLLVQRA
jgi:hypothetical protein